MTTPGEFDYILCVTWGRQRLLSVKVDCAICHAALALSNDNVAFCQATDKLPLCHDCLPCGVHEIGGMLVGGQLYRDPREALRAYELLTRRN